MFKVPIVEETTLMSFKLAAVTFGLTAMPSIIAVNSKKRDSRVISIAVSLVPSAFSTQNRTPTSALKDMVFEFSFAVKF